MLYSLPPLVVDLPALSVHALGSGDPLLGCPKYVALSITVLTIHPDLVISVHQKHANAVQTPSRLEFLFALTNT